MFGTTVMLMTGLYFFLTRTYLGKAFRACAMNRDAVGLMGSPTRSMRGIGFLLSGFVGGVADVIVAPIALMQHDSGTPSKLAVDSKIEQC